MSAPILALYRRINGALWERYSRGEIDPPTLTRERFRQLLQAMGADPGAAAKLGRNYIEALSSRGDLVPGCRAILARLARRYRLGLVTNGIDRVQRSRLRAARLERRFDVLVTSEGCGFAKPDPRILLVALDALGLRPSEAVYVGDDVRTDGGAAAGAGVRFCWMDRGVALPPGVRRPRRRVTALAELLELLG